MTKYQQLQEYLKNNQSTWLVTGAAGFIGSNLLEKLLILNRIYKCNFKILYNQNFSNKFHDQYRI